jgi:hypothetical protein
MAKCSVTLDNTQKNLLRGDLAMSDFAYELSDYYQGEAHAFPDISVLSRFVNDDIIPKYFKGSFKLQDLYDFLHDNKNSFALGEAINSMLYSVDMTNPQDLPEPDYVKNPGIILEALRQDAINRLSSDEVNRDNEREVGEAIDSSSEGLASLDDYKHQFLKNYTGIEAYRVARFKGSSTTEIKLISKFINDVLVKSALINTDTKELVSARQIPGVFGKEGAPVDFNLKEYRKSLLEDLINRTNLHTVVDGVPTKVEFSDRLLEPSRFTDTLKAIEERVNAVKYNGENVLLSDEGKLVQISNELKKTNDSKLQDIIDNYVDYVLLADFDKLFDYYGNGVIHVADYNGDFDQYSRKYGLVKANSIDAANVNWTDRIHNGVDLSPELYKTIIEVTPMLSFTTGQPINDYLYPALVSQVMSKYDAKIDPRTGARSVKKAIIDGLNDTQNSFLNKNVLYTMYRKFFEQEGDRVNLPFKKGSDYKVSSFMDTLSSYRDKSLLDMVVKPLQETKKVLYAEATEINREPAIVQSGTKGFNVSYINAGNDITNAINKGTVEEVNKIVEDYGIKFNQASITYKTPGTDTTYELTPRGTTAYDKATIMKLSHDLLGIDFEENNAHKEFLQDLESRATGKDALASSYITFMYEALKGLQAKAMLFDPKVQETIKEKGSKAEFSGVDLLNETIKRADFKDNTNDEIAANKIQIRTVASDLVYRMLADAENRYAGNRIKSTVVTPEGTMAAGFSTHTLFLGLPQTHQAARDVLSSVKGNDRNRSPLASNPFIVDSNLLTHFEVRSATKIGSTVKSNSEMTDQETMVYNISLGYFDKMARAINGAKEIQPLFDITTYSDKTTNYMATIANSFLSTKLFIDNGVAVPEDVTRALHYDSVGNYYKAFGSNVVDTWRSIYNKVSPEAGAQFEQAMSAGKTVSSKLAALNELNEKFWKEDLVDTDGKPKFQHGLTGLHAARFYADAAGVALNNWVHYQNNAKSINVKKIPLIVKPSLIDYTRLFEAPTRRDYDTYMNKLMVSSVKEMMNMGYSFDMQASRNIAQLYPTLEDRFKNGVGQIFLTAYGKVPNRVEDINPAFRKYFNDFNFVAENIMNSAVGPIYAHKGDSPFKAWITQVKRNVAATASMRKYSLGLENGVENSTNVAFIDDFVTDLKTILGEEHAVVDMDGASLETITQRIKTWNSLNYKFAGDGGPDHKSLFSHFDPNTGQFGLTKHAAFVMDYDMIRNSIGSDVDLMELHKKLWATDISKVDITKSSANDVNLSFFQDEPVYYWDRSYDHEKGQAGYIYKLESIEYKGKDPSTKESIYTIKKRNLSADPDTVLVENNQRINTMFDLWKTLGGIDSVDLSSDKTSIGYSHNNDTIHFKPSITSAHKLLDYECYIGKPNESVLPAEYIKARTNSDVASWNTYSKLFHTDGVVNSHIDLIRGYLNQDPNKFEVQTSLADQLHDYDVKVDAPTFLKVIHENKAQLEGFFNRITDKFAAKEGRTAFDPEYEAKYQRFKGKNVDRLSFAGAQKVGQFQMNDTAVISKRKLAEFNIAPDGTLRHEHQVGDTVLYDGKSYKIASIEARGDIQNQLSAEPEGTFHTSGKEDTGHNVYTIRAGKGKAITVTDSDIQSTKATIIPKIPGITDILTHPISNLNGGVQLNAWHEAEDSQVTAPTQMLNALIFNGKSIEDVSDIYRAIGDIVDTNLTYALQDPDIVGKQKINIPQMVRGLSNAEFYKENKDTLLKVFHDLLKQSIKENDFTLESVIKNTFTSANLPIDDPHIFNSAVADLTNYFTKNGIRINFDGIFSVLAPSSGILQLHDVKGGALPIREANGSLSYRQLDPNRITTLSKDDFKNWLDYRKHLEANPHKQSENGLGEIIDHVGRDLKGQQVTLQYQDGRQVDLSILRAKQEHLIPEAEALSKVNELIETYKNGLSDKGYKSQTPQEKIEDLKDYYEAFKNDFSELVGTDPRVKYVFDSIRADVNRVDPKESTGDLIDYMYENFHGNAAYRKYLNAKYEVNKDYANLVLSNEYDLLDKLSQVAKAFTGKLQAFLDSAATGVIPVSLTRSELFDPNKYAEFSKDLNTAKVVISRAECIAPLTAKNSFLLREGDNLSDVDEHFFVKRLNERLDYLDAEADGVLISKFGRKLFLHNKRVPKEVTPTQFVRTIGETNWYTNESGDPLFIIPRNVTIANLGGNIHAYVKDENAAKSLKTSVDSGFADAGDKFRMVPLRGTPEEKAQRQLDTQAEVLAKAKIMWNSWQKYLQVIGTRIPGQHFQSFQGMKIVGFSGEGNKIHIANEVTLLSGSDFDIDKQNVIYHSINRDGSLALWHPASRYDTVDNIEKSMKLPLQMRKQEDAFVARKDATGAYIDQVMRIDDSSDLKDLNTLLDIYDRLKRGERLDRDLHPNTIATLVHYDNVVDTTHEDNDPYAIQMTSLNNGVKGIKNFAISRTNATIENPSNFIYLSKPVSMDVPALFADNSPKGEAAKGADPHKPNSIASAKLDNMVGKKVIGIMATGLKVWSGVSLAYNNELRNLAPVVNEMNRISRLRSELEADPIANHAQLEQLRDEYTTQAAKVDTIVEALRLDQIPLANSRVQQFGQGLDLIPNLNYDKISSDVLHEVFKRINPENRAIRDILARIEDPEDNTNPLILKDYLKTRNMFEDDAAEIMSQLLSAATDNAKELILAKINASPDLAGIYAAMLMLKTPFEQIAEKMTSPFTEVIIKKGTKNVYDKSTNRNSISDLLTNLTEASAEPTDDKKKASIDRAIGNLKDRYNIVPSKSVKAVVPKFYDEKMTPEERAKAFASSDVTIEEVVGQGFRDLDSGTSFYSNEAKEMKILSDTAREISLLGRMFGINQGVRSDTWGLYNFRSSIEDYVTKATGKQFSFKEFLDSLSGDQSYANQMIDEVSKTRQAFNILYVLAKNPHFAEQLKAYNAAHTILGLSSYKVNATAEIVKKLRAINFLGESQNVTEDQYRDIERFVENSILENFIEQETVKPRLAKSSPIFYDGDKEMHLMDPASQEIFAKWVREKFLPRIKDIDAYRGNEFVQGLTTDTKNDPLLHDKFGFVKLKVDTTNAQSVIQQGNKDSYTYGLKRLYDQGATDMQHPDNQDKNNNIVNTLFWYNLILNKNSITKNSYAKMLGEVMGLGEGESNPYRALLELKGNIGKNERSQNSAEGLALVMSNGVMFDLMDLFKSYDSFVSDSIEYRGGSRKGGEEEFDADIDPIDDQVDEVDDVPDEIDTTDVGESTTDLMPDEFGTADDEAGTTRPPKIKIEKTRTTGTVGTYIKVFRDGDNEPLFDGTISAPSSLIPHNSEFRSKYTFHTEYNPLATRRESINDRDSINYQKMLHLTMHDLLSNLAGKLDIQIIQRAGDKEVISKFDPTQTYDCI